MNRLSRVIYFSIGLLACALAYSLPASASPHDDYLRLYPEVAITLSADDAKSFVLQVVDLDQKVALPKREHDQEHRPKYRYPHA